MRTLISLLAATIMLAAAPAVAAPLAGIDAMTATIFQEGQSSFSGLGVRLRVTSDRLAPGVELLPTIEYWRNSSSIGAFGIESTRKDATLGMDVRYRFHAGSWEPYVGGGLSLHFLSNRVNAPSLGLTDANDSLTKGAIGLLGGVNFKLTDKVDNFLELKYHHVSDYRQLKLNWGLGYNF